MIARFPACGVRLLAVIWTMTAASAADELPVQTWRLSEHARPGQVVGELSTLVAGGPYCWRFASPGEVHGWQLDETTGRLEVADGAKLDFESCTCWTLGVVAESLSDRGAAADFFAADLQDSGLCENDAHTAAGRRQLLTIRVELIDEPEAPVWQIDRGSMVRLSVAQPLWEHPLFAADVDAGDELRYEIIGGNDQRWLHCDASSGRLSLAADRALPHGAARQPLQVVLRVTDAAGLSAETLLPVELYDPHAWPVPAPAAALVEEPPVVGTTAVDVPIPQVAETAAVELGPDPDVAAVLGSSTVPTIAADPASDSPASQPTAARPTAARPIELASESSPGLRLPLLWFSLACLPMCLAAVTSVWLRRRKSAFITESLAVAAESAAEGEDEQPLIPAASARSIALTTSPARSLRAEMANLQALSQHFTVTEKAHQERVFHSRQFRLAAVATLSAAGIVVIQSLFGLERAFGQENLLVFACLCVATAAAIKALIAVRQATERLRTPGPLSGQFRLDSSAAG